MASSLHTPPAQRFLLGRDRELSEFAAALDQLGSGRGGLLLVTGEPGIGKTRFGDECARAAAARGLAVHWGRAWEAGGAPSYWPFVQVLRSVCRGLSADELATLAGPHGGELAELLPELRQAIPGLAFAPLHGTQDRFQLFDAVSRFLHAVGARAPQLLVLDDLHAADPSCLLLLQFLVRDLQSAALLIIGTYRDAEARLNAELGPTLAQLTREAMVLPLRRLDRAEVEEFVAHAIGAAPSAERVETFHRRTEGNPLFLRELLRVSAAQFRQPEGIRETVRARLSLLTSPVRSVLEAAAVLGREFAFDPLARISEQGESELRALLMPAADAGIIEPLEQARRWRFTHVLLREGLYEDLTPERRLALHASAAAELARRLGEPSRAELAHHLLRAVPLVTVAAAVDAALSAAQRALDILAFEDASSLLGRTLSVLEHAAHDDRQRVEVLLALGIARIRSAEVELGKETCRSAAALARSIGQGELFARAALGSAYEYTPGVRDAELIASLEEALSLLPPDDSGLRARCMAQLAAERQPEPDTQAPVALARAAVAMARRLGDAETLRFTLASAGMAMLVYAEPEERWSVNQEALRLALAAGDKRLALRAHLFLCNDAAELGDPKGSEAHARAYEALAAQFPHRAFSWVAIGLRGAAALWEGRFSEAEAYYCQAQELMLSDETRGASMAALPIGLCRALERYDDLPGIEAGVRARFGALDAQQSQPATTAAVGGCVGELLIAQLYGRAGDRQRAARQLALLRAHPAFPLISEPAWLALLAEAIHLLGAEDLAERIYPLLLPRAQRFFNLGPLAPCYEPPYARQLGLLAQTLGRLDEAIAQLADAEARCAQVGQRSHLARLRYELAGALLARDARGDAERAASLLDAARALAEQLGQHALLPLLAARTSARHGAPEASSVTAPLDGSNTALTLRREGEYWVVGYGERSARLRDSRGLQLLEQLVNSPGQEFHVLQLMSASEGDVAGDAGEVLDRQAVQQYRARLLELREELEAAEGFADAGRSERAREQIEVLTQELARAVGLGGRERRASNAAERARTTVQKRLRNALQRIDDALPELGTHLDHAIRTGIFCGYLPDARKRTRRAP